MNYRDNLKEIEMEKFLIVVCIFGLSGCIDSGKVVLSTEVDCVENSMVLTTKFKDYHIEKYSIEYINIYKNGITFQEFESEMIFDYLYKRIKITKDAFAKIKGCLFDI